VAVDLNAIINNMVLFQDLLCHAKTQELNFLNDIINTKLAKNKRKTRDQVDKLQI